MFFQIFFLSISFDYFLLFIFDWKKLKQIKKNKEKKGNKEKHRNTKNKIVIKFEKIFHQTKKLSNIC